MIKQTEPSILDKLYEHHSSDVRLPWLQNTQRSFEILGSSIDITVLLLSCIFLEVNEICIQHWITFDAHLYYLDIYGGRGGS